MNVLSQFGLGKLKLSARSGALWLVLLAGVPLAVARMDPALPRKNPSENPAPRGPKGNVKTNSTQKAESSGSKTNAATKSDDEKKPDPVKPYAKVITKDARSEKGLVWTHRVDEKVYFEIPTNEFGKELLWVTQIERTQAGFGYGGTPVGNHVVRWELRDKDVLLREVKYAIRADGSDYHMRASVDATSVEPIIRKFSVAAWGTNHAAVIEVGDFYLSDPSEFSAKTRLNANGADKARSFIERVKTFPDNVEVKVTMTYTLSAQGGGNRDPSQSGVTVLLHHSLVRLPAEPMRPRESDSRVGFFAVDFDTFTPSEHQVKPVRYITRWRLEKTDPDAAVSEVKKPIVFYVGRGVPDKWRPFVKKGIEAWKPVFEAAGFTNAIKAIDAPTEKEDPDWDAEDARYSTIQWLPSSIENAMGPHVHDPRTGEILDADILVYHNVLKLARDWYFVQVSPLDPRAQKLPLPDDLEGELLAYVITHEVGHSLGFPHNMKASSAYTAAQLRDPEFTKKNGNEASIMDYGRFNYVAQPGDGARLIPILGPYDYFALEWGYREFKKTATREEEKKALDKLAARQVQDPMLRFGDPNALVDPSQQTEDLGSDAIEATTLGLKNIERVAGFLVSATCKEGENYDQLENMYTQLLRQRDRELGHVANMVGGIVRNNVWFGQGDRTYDIVPAARQREAVSFLNRNAFQVPDYLVSQSILQRLDGLTGADRILSSQRGILSLLFDAARFKRLGEIALAQPDHCYAATEMMDDIRQGIWSELEMPEPIIALYRRNLQRVWVDALENQVSRSDAATDQSALARAGLVTLQKSVAPALSRVKDSLTRAHLLEIAAQVDRILDPRGAQK